MDYANVLKHLIRAERSGDWDLHLYALERMLNLFGATCDFNYAECARLLTGNEKFEGYTPLDLQVSQEKKGYHTVRRSDWYCAGLWTDLIIEQVMMRFLKTRGEIMRGGGMTDSIRLVWVGNMHRRVGIHEAMTILTNLKRNTSEQHVELTSSLRRHDKKSMEKIISSFDTHNPFYPMMEELRSLSTGLTASDSDNINCSNAENMGLQMQRKLDGVCFKEISMIRNDQIHSLACL